LPAADSGGGNRISSLPLHDYRAARRKTKPVAAEWSMRSHIINLSRLGRSAARSARATRLVLIVVAAIGIAYVASSARSDEPRGRLDPACEAWDAAASAALKELIADRSEIAAAQLGDAVFRLRRARKNCRHQWLNLARLDYVSLTDGRYGRRR
jgi:hypothetical protein